MLKTVDTLEMKESFEKLLNEVIQKNDQILIKKEGKAIAVVISPSEYEAYKKQRKKNMKIFDEIRKLNKGTNPEELEKDIQEAIQVARK